MVTTVSIVERLIFFLSIFGNHCSLGGVLNYEGNNAVVILQKKTSQKVIEPTSYYTYGNSACRTEFQQNGVSGIEYDLYTYLSHEECWEICNQQDLPSCKGIEYSQDRCEIWRVDIEVVEIEKRGFFCMIKKDHQQQYQQTKIMSMSNQEEDFLSASYFEGHTGRACRTKNNGFGEIDGDYVLITTDLYTCWILCLNFPNICRALEHNSINNACEIWKTYPENVSDDFKDNVYCIKKELHPSTQVESFYNNVYLLDLGGKEHLLETILFRATFENTLKNYIQKSLECNFPETGKDYATIESVEIVEGVTNYERRLSSNNSSFTLRASGRCRGRRCQEGFNFLFSSAGRKLYVGGKTKSKAVTTNVACEGSTLQASFKNRVFKSGVFKYDISVDIRVNVDVLFDYGVKFQETDADGLNTLKKIDLILLDEAMFEQSPKCSTNECKKQKDTVSTIYKHFEVTNPYENFHECSWSGINCNFNGEITQLYLEDVKPRKEIPNEVSQLEKLQALYLGENELVGTIPIALGSLPNIEMIYLKNNKLSGNIPAEIGGLSSFSTIRELYLGSNTLSGSIPTSFNQLTSLRILEIGLNRLSGNLNFVESLKELKDLNLRSNNFVGTIPSGFKNLERMQKLNLGHNDLSGKLFFLEHLKQLQQFDVSWNQLSGPLVYRSRNQLFDLQTFSVFNNSMTGSIPPNLFKNKRLEELAIGRNAFTGPISSDIGNLSLLKTLSLEENALSSSIPSEIGEIKQLRVLCLQYNKLDGNLPSELASILSLETFFVNNNQISGTLPSELLKLTNFSEVILSPNNYSPDSENIAIELSEIVEEAFYYSPDLYFDNNIEESFNQNNV